MRFYDTLSLSLQSLQRGGLRSILSMLGIVIGIASVILILSISEAGQRYIINQVANFGSDLLFVENGSPEESEGGGIPTPFPKEVLTQRDYEKLKSQSWMRLITPMIYQSDTVSIGGESMTVQIVGTSEDEVPMYDMRMETGVFFEQEDVDARRRVAVLGSDVAERLFGFENPVGKSIEIGERRFRILGVTAPGGTRFLQNVDEQIYLPYTSVLDLTNRDRLLALIMKTTLPIDEAPERIRNILRDQHNIDDPKDDDFRLFTQEDTAEQTAQITSALQIFLVAVAAISLFVGGIGIMNIMYVTVTERTKEIGLRKSIGARTSSILAQFLIESILLTFTGGIIGTICGILFTWGSIQIISLYQSGWDFHISVTGILLGVCFSSVIGILFGYAPARHAARIRPIEALRYE